MPPELAGVAPFEAVSSPVRVTIASPLALVVRPRPSPPLIRAGTPVALAQLFALELLNTSSAPVEVTTPGTPYTFELVEQGQGFLAGTELPLPNARPESASLAPGARLTLLGPGARFGNAPAPSWRPTRAGTFVLQGAFTQNALGRVLRRVVSEPFTLEVAPAP